MGNLQRLRKRDSLPLLYRLVSRQEGGQAGESEQAARSASQAGKRGSGAFCRMRHMQLQGQMGHDE